MRKPDFLLIGAAKAGTTSLAAHLGQHPQIHFSPLKEPNFFALRDEDPIPTGPAPEYVLRRLIYHWSELDEQRYYKLFEKAGSGQVTGEGSVRYLYFPDAPKRIAAAVPDIRLVAVLRNPVDRVYSHYNMNFQQHLEPLSLEEAMEAERGRIEAGWGWDWHYAAASDYAAQLARYLDLFGPEQIKIIFYEDLVRQPQQTFDAICTHIGVSPGFKPDMSARLKAPYRCSAPRIDRLLTWPHPVKDAFLGRYLAKGEAGLAKVAGLLRVPAPKLDPQTRSALAARFADENARLSELLGRKLPW